MTTLISSLTVAIGSNGAILTKLGAALVADGDAAAVRANILNHGPSLFSRSSGAAEGGELYATKVLAETRERNSSGGALKPMVVSALVVAKTGQRALSMDTLMVPDDVYADVDADLRNMAVAMTSRLNAATEGDALSKSRIYLEINQPQ